VVESVEIVVDPDGYWPAGNRIPMGDFSLALKMAVFTPNTVIMHPLLGKMRVVGSAAPIPYKRPLSPQRILPYKYKE